MQYVNDKYAERQLNVCRRSSAEQARQYLRGSHTAHAPRAFPFTKPLFALGMCIALDDSSIDARVRCFGNFFGEFTSQNTPISSVFGNFSEENGNFSEEIRNFSEEIELNFHFLRRN